MAPPLKKAPKGRGGGASLINSMARSLDNSEQPGKESGQLVSKVLPVEAKAFVAVWP
jgi:hypothetical protein